jgi:cephalosporin hydroxylase
MAMAMCDLTVVVVFYNMRREAARTLHSLSRAYQRDVEDLDYEVLVVENGSSPDQALGADYVRSFGPEFRYLDMGDDAEPSPVAALNAGIAKSRGRAFALMIDGAHVLTPGVLHYGMLGLRTYEPAIVGTQQWYVGPGQQGDVIEDGYDTELEDQLLDDIAWPTDGYRLFDIGHFVGDRDWLDGLWESNCLFVPRSLLAQSGTYERAFDVPGGSYANLEIYERLGATPGVTAVTVLGEGSFHQSHGGTTTNQPDIAERNRRIASYAAEYAELRGRPFKGLDKQMHFVGSMPWEACRTRARRRVAPNLYKRNAPGDPDGRPEKPTPMPEDLAEAYLDAYWRSFKWREVSWLGTKAEIPPSDLVAYQELVSEVRPDWIIETASGSPGGRALFLASVCDLIDHGRVISIDPNPKPELPEHPRITRIEGKAHDDEVVARVRDLAGDSPHAMVVIGTRGARMRTILEFEAYEPMVRTGSYIVVENTILNGNPVWASFGLGPWEAVRQLLVDHRDFAADTGIDKRYPGGFNRGGWLKRVRES